MANWLQDMISWISNPAQQMYDRVAHAGQAEGGVDVFSPIGTPVYALADGPIIASGFNNVDGKGVITTRVNVPGYGTQDLFYQHIDMAPGIANCGGLCKSGQQIVQKGQLIGYVSDPQGRWSPHIELGFNAGWCCAWGDPNNHPGSWMSFPEPLIAALMKAGGGGPGTGTTGSSGTGGGTGGSSTDNSSSFPATCAPWDIRCSIAAFTSSNTARQMGLLFIGLIFLLIGVQIIFFGNKESA
jgi:Peptidase family M23